MVNTSGGMRTFSSSSWWDSSGHSKRYSQEKAAGIEQMESSEEWWINKINGYGRISLSGNPKWEVHKASLHRTFSLMMKIFYILNFVIE